MKNIVMARIDDRLLHGQVVVSWLPFIKANEVIVIDDENANDEFMKELIISSSPNGIITQVMTLEESINFLREPSKNERILILTKKIDNINELLDSKIKIDTVNLGNLGHRDDRKRYLNFIHLSEKEVKMLQELDEMNSCNLEIQMIPNEKKYSLKELLKD